MKWLTAAFSIFLLLIILLADLGKLATLGLYRVPYADKAGHFFLYGILALLVNLTLLRSRPSSSRLSLAVTSGLVLAALIGLEEWSQHYFASRSFSLADLSASYLGVILFSWLAMKVHS